MKNIIELRKFRTNSENKNIENRILENSIDPAYLGPILKETEMELKNMGIETEIDLDSLINDINKEIEFEVEWLENDENNHYAQHLMENFTDEWILNNRTKI
jgi:hypothetical protein